MVQNLPEKILTVLGLNSVLDPVWTENFGLNWESDRTQTGNGEKPAIEDFDHSRFELGIIPSLDREFSVWFPV
jgi:hypothetical protein